MAELEVLAALGGPGVVAIFRTASPDGVLEACRALQDNGIGAVEITLTTPGALSLIESVATGLGDSLAVGAGTVLDRTAARACLEAGASFVVLPGFADEVLAECRSAGVLCLPGALTPSEVMTAVRAGADVIKLFPSRFATPGYLADLLGPMPAVRFVPTGGIDSDLARQYIRAGAFAVGVGGSLVPPAAVLERDTAAIGRAATELLSAVAEGRVQR